MRQSLRLRFALLLLVAAFSVFSLWEFFLGGRPPASTPEYAPNVVTPLPCSPNATLIRMATTEVGEAELRTDIESLLEGSFTPVYEGGFGRRRFWSYSPWRWENHHKPWRRVSLPAQFRVPKYMGLYPEFRRSLRDWFQKRSLQLEVMSELVRLIKRPIDLHFGRPDSLQRFNSCAVVGNSGILMKNDHGELIDAHNLVIRLNNARVHGYHRNVGSKTGLSFVNSNILHVCARREGCFCHPYGENVPIVMYICQGLHFLDFTICNSSHKAPLLVTDLRFDMLCTRIVKYYSLKLFVEETGKPLEEWKKFHDEKLFHYSSGMQAVMLAVGICDQVSIFGFGKSSDAKHHYHTNQKKELDLHDYKAEYALYNDLVEQPQIVEGYWKPDCHCQPRAMPLQDLPHLRSILKTGKASFNKGDACHLLGKISSIDLRNTFIWWIHGRDCNHGLFEIEIYAELRMASARQVQAPRGPEAS